MKVLANVVGTGAITSVGLRAADTAMSHRAAATGIRGAPLLDPEGEAVSMGFSPVIEPRATGAARAFALSARAFDEAVEVLAPALQNLRVRVGLAVDDHLAPAPELRLASEELATSLVRRLGKAPPTNPAFEVSTRGAAGAGFLLPILTDALAAGSIDAAILGGVHTDYDPTRIAALAATGRLFSPKNLEAVIPGEAAAFVVLMRGDVARRHQLVPRLEINAVATGREKARFDNDESAFQATALTAALRAVLAPAADAGFTPGWLLTDLDFETFRHFELHAATLRNAERLGAPRHVDSPAQRIGSLGAAALPLSLVLAAEAHRRGFAPHPLAIAIGGSEAGDRAAVLVARPS